jgi:flagellar biosynthetic protein FlhB
MSKQEIREEMKDIEGNPQMKAKIRRIQRDRARKQMMKEVPTASAVVVNPTHFAVAIRYNMDSMAAPLVVAKGKKRGRRNPGLHFQVDERQATRLRT